MMNINITSLNTNDYNNYNNIQNHNNIIVTKQKNKKVRNQ